MDDRYFDIKNYIGITRRMKYDFCHVKLWIKIKHIKLIGKCGNTQSRGPWRSSFHKITARQLYKQTKQKKKSLYH